MRIDLQRYNRQVCLPEMGAAGQKALSNARVLVIGAGGLGSPNILYLAAAGVGKIGILDGDVIDVSNLNRQILHSTQKVGTSKAASACARVAELNPDVETVLHEEWFTHENAERLVSDYDLVIDAVDNFPTKYLVNDACVLGKKPFIHAGVVGWKGQVLAHKPGTACLRCLVSEPTPGELAPTCARAGILGATAGLVACVQALHALKIILGADHKLYNKVTFIDGLTSKMRDLKLSRSDTCPLCGNNPTITYVDQIEVPVCELKK